MVLAPPISPDAVPPPPAHLKEDGRGRAYWQTYWEGAGSWLTAADLPGLTRLCELWDLWQDVKEGMLSQGDGHIYTVSRRRGTTGKYVGHPMLSTLRELATLMEHLEAGLGLNPVERSRIRIERGEKGSPLDEWSRNRAARKAEAG